MGTIAMWMVKVAADEITTERSMVGWVLSDSPRSVFMDPAKRFGAYKARLFETPEAAMEHLKACREMKMHVLKGDGHRRFKLQIVRAMTIHNIPEFFRKLDEAARAS